MKQLDFTPRPKTNRVGKQIYLYPDTWDKVDTLCRVKDQPRGAVVESLLKFFEDNR